MLTPEIRTMDMKEVIELWNTDNKKLKIKLLDDYHDLAKEYRNQIKIYNQEGHKTSKLWLERHSCTPINYQAELGIEEYIRDKIIFSEDFTENIKIGLEIFHSMLSNRREIQAYVLAETIRLKAREIEDVLQLLNIKVPYVKDFEKQNNWLHEDLDELRLQEFKEAEEKQKEIKERAKYLCESIDEEGASAL
jgi:hypothetical protein